MNKFISAQNPFTSKCEGTHNVQKMKFSIKDFFSICDQIRSFLRIWSDLLKKSLMENFIFLCSVLVSNVAGFHVQSLLRYKMEIKHLLGVLGVILKTINLRTPFFRRQFGGC